MTEESQHTYICIDLKSFYASVECVERHLDPLKANLLVADESRTDKTICLAVSPALKAVGVPGRPRLFEAKQAIGNAENALHRKIDYIIAPPRMATYIKYSAKVYSVYLKLFSAEDIHVYSVDEVFIDITPYAAIYTCSAHDLVRMVIQEILKETGLTEKYRSLQRVKVDETVRIYTLEGYSDFFYNYMVPSTGYVSKFELMKYREGLLLRHPSAQNPGVIPDYVDEYRVYNALKEERQWNHLLGVQYQADINDRIESGAYRTLIKLSEALHDKKIVEIADRISKEEKKVVLILGPSSSGKTTFAHRLIIQLMVNGMKPLYIGTDDYFVEREDTPLDADGQKNYENIDALDLPLFNRQMKDLLEGREVDMPVFNFKTGHKEFGKRKTRLARNGVIVIEGIHAFNHLLTRQLPEESKFRIYISPLTQINLDSHNRIPTTDTRVIRRIVRDNRNRAHTAAMTLHLWPKVREGENKNIFPLSNEADVFFNTVHVYEMTVLKKYAVPLLKEVRQEEEEYAEAQRLLRLFRYVDSLDDESIIAGDSILREFIGGSIYTD